jgi:hypothetical protein
MDMGLKLSPPHPCNSPAALLLLPSSHPLPPPFSLPGASVDPLGGGESGSNVTPLPPLPMWQQRMHLGERPLVGEVERRTWGTERSWGCAGSCQLGRGMGVNFSEFEGL